jgi:hypothetical protein
MADANGATEAGSCPGFSRKGTAMLEKLLQLTLPLALAIGIWISIVLPWGGAG